MLILQLYKRSSLFSLIILWKPYQLKIQCYICVHASFLWLLIFSCLPRLSQSFIFLDKSVWSFGSLSKNTSRSIKHPLYCLNTVSRNSQLRYVLSSIHLPLQSHNLRLSFFRRDRILLV